MKALIYARCSTDENRQDVEVQLKELRGYCERQGWQFDEVSEYGSGYSGDKQPKLDEAIERIRLKHYNVMVVHNIDRFSRQKPSKVNRMLDVIVEDYKCRFITIQNGLDSDNEMMWHWVRGGMTWAANAYSKNLGERVKNGINRKKELGVYRGGRPKKAVDAQHILNLRSQGLGLRSIAAKMNEGRRGKERISFQTVRRVLQKGNGISLRESSQN